MNNTNSNKGTGLVVSIVVLVIGLLVASYVMFRKSDSPKDLDAFAQCVAKTGLTMYGAYWCPHCLNEKKAFGNSFKYINYVECTEDIKICTDKGVLGYPTWIFPDGRKLEGEQGIQKISEATNCPISPI